MSLKQKVICFCLVAVTLATLLGTIVAAGFPKQYDLKINDVSPSDIYATRQVVDTVTTEAHKKAEIDRVEPQYVVDDYAVDSADTALTRDFRELRSSRSQLVSPANPDDIFYPENNTFLTLDQFQTVLDLPANDFETLAKYTPQFIMEIMSAGVTDPVDALAVFNSKFDSVGVVDFNVLTLANVFAEKYITVNKVYSEELTKQRQEEAASRVEPEVYLKGQVIVRKGELISEAVYEVLSQLGVVKGESVVDTSRIFTSAGLIMIVFALIVAYYLMVGKNEITTTHISATAICAILIIIGALIIFLARGLTNNLFYLMPLSMVPALTSLLLNANLATMVNVVIAALAGVQFNDPAAALSIIIAGTATAYIFTRVRRRAHLLPATITSAVIHAVVYAAVFASMTESLAVALTIAFYSLAGSFFGGILTIGTIPFWEGMFDVITPMKLGELSNPEHKLLKKLLLKAPGSYHHALTVANMADSAAAAINANALLARVGAYYHDIGKMENPSFFKENQLGDNNPHDELPPEESARIIISHVTDGAHLAQQYHLPRAVRDIILQHHGTTTASFFLYKAREKNPNVDPADFTYDGPAPYSKEATIIMLADACEAAVRAMREKGFEDVSVIVNDIVSSRISDGQLSSSLLTFSDLDKVKASFVKTLEQYFHKRILYPQNKK